jgi:hypothetical protein
MNANPIGIVDHDMFVVRKNGVIYRMIVVEVIASFRFNIQMFLKISGKFCLPDCRLTKMTNLGQTNGDGHPLIDLVYD